MIKKPENPFLLLDLFHTIDIDLGRRVPRSM